MSILILQSSWRERESWLLCYYCLTDVLKLVMFCGPSSRCRGVGLQCVSVVFPDHTIPTTFEVFNMAKKIWVSPGNAIITYFHRMEETNWASAWDFQQCGLYDQQSLKYQGSKPYGFRQEDLFMFYPILSLYQTCDPRGRGHFWHWDMMWTNFGRGLLHTKYQGSRLMVTRRFFHVFFL